MKKNIPKFKLDSADRVVLAIVGALGIIYGYAQVLASKPIYQDVDGPAYDRFDAHPSGSGGADRSGASGGHIQKETQVSLA
jgi:hypothetical protein